MSMRAEGLAAHPPMGWNSWNTFGPHINEQLIFETADRMVDEGYLEAGYEYLVIDDCWSLKERDAEGRLVADPEKFPHGMKAVADYVHAKGLKFGMYSCAGTLTCAGYPASFDHEFLDAETFASWDVDFLKYDFCYFPRTADCKTHYRRIAMALKACGRPILLSACNWGVEDPWTWMQGAGAQMYRSTGDINESFRSIMDIADSQEPNLAYNGPYCWNDMDMLVVGMYGKGNVAFTGGCTDAEYRTHFALWCLFSVPLMMGADLRDLRVESKALLLNKDLIAIDQDPEARAPYRLWDEKDGRRSYCKHLSDGTYVLAYFNPSEQDAQVNSNFEDAGLQFAAGYAMELTDVFTGEVIRRTEYYNPIVPAHDCKVYKARLVRR